MKVPVIGTGNSSLKYQLMDLATREIFAKGLCERIGIDGRLAHKVPTEGAKCGFEVPMPIHSEAIQAVPDALLDTGHGVIKSASEIDAADHRMIHDGEKFASPVYITDEVMIALEECIPLAPLHNPTNITGIKTYGKVMPGMPMVGVFDTAFRQIMPAKSYIYALPYEFYEQNKVRRYGSHGTSHRYVSARAAAMLGKSIEELKTITCHLGNGSSVVAVDGGRSVDTSMGFTPLTGVPMGARAGDPDIDILEYLMGKHGYDMKEMMTILDKESGVLGISGVPSDFRDLESATKEGSQRAKLALEAFQCSVRKLVGAYAVAMGGVDAIVFTAGVSENDAVTRMAVASDLEFVGVKMDAGADNVRGREAVISSTGSEVKVLLIPTDEELMIVIGTIEIVSK